MSRIDKLNFEKKKLSVVFYTKTSFEYSTTEQVKLPIFIRCCLCTKFFENVGFNTNKI